MVWSFSVADPTDPLGATALFHDHMGSLSVNLLSGIIEPPAEPDDLRYFDVVVSNVRTYSIIIAVYMLHGYPTRYSYSYNYKLS